MWHPSGTTRLQVNAARVADYLASQAHRGSAFLVVSHKPQVGGRARAWVRQGGLGRAALAGGPPGPSPGSTSCTIGRCPAWPASSCCQVYERAGCLVGVYSRGGASDVVTLHVQPDEAGSA